MRISFIIQMPRLLRQWNCVDWFSLISALQGISQSHYLYLSLWVENNEEETSLQPFTCAFRFFSCKMGTMSRGEIDNTLSWCIPSWTEMVGAPNSSGECWGQRRGPGLIGNATSAFSCGLAMSVHESWCYCKVFSGILLYRIEYI